MTVEYNVKILNRAGVRQYEVTNFLGLDYSKYVNDVGLLNVELSGRHPAIDALEKDGQIQVWRFDDDIDPYCDFYGLYRGRNRATPNGGSRDGRFVMKCVSQLHYLKRALIGFPAGVNLRNDFTADPAETVMKLMVQYNATADATVANGRFREPTWATLIDVAADTAAGSNITKAFAHRNLLEALQEVAVLGGLDFDLVKTGDRTWEFRTYTLLGVDRTATVKFSIDWDNLGNPTLVGNDIEEATVARVGGEGQEELRDFDTFTGPNYTADYNDIEVFVNAANQGAGSLEAAGNDRLNDMRARDDFRFDVLQSGPFRYGRDYCVAGGLGDKVSVLYYEGTATKKIRGAHVMVNASSGGQKAEQIRLDMVNA